MFLGTPDFAVGALKRISEKHEVVAVVTQPDKPRGRSGKPTYSAVKQQATELGLPVYQFEKIRRDGVETLKELKADVFVTAAYGQILSQEIIDIPKYGILNIHASLLPKYRGAAPIQWSIINGDEYTGVTIMKTEAGIDTGDTLISEKIRIGERETAGELFDRLSELGANLIIGALELVESGKAVYVKQNEEQATHVRMLKKEDGLIDWSKAPKQIFDLVRGCSPWPGAYTYYKGKLLKIHSAEVGEQSQTGEPGEVLLSDKNTGIIVQAGGGTVKITELQAEGAKRMSAYDYLLGRKLEKGELLGNEVKKN